MYCICQKRNDDFLVRCELCYDWFHGKLESASRFPLLFAFTCMDVCILLATCVPLPKIFDLGDEDGVTSLAVVCEKITEGLIKYLCPCCCRSRRPKLETILELLEALQELPVKIFEGEVLTLLADRAMKWLDDARKLLNNATVIEAFNTVERESAIEPKPGYMKELVDTIGSPTKSQKHDTASGKDCSPNKGGQNMETNHYAQSDLRKVEEQQFAPPLIKLSENLMSELENILIEGNLMEITFEELHKLWKIYEGAQPKPSNIPDLRVSSR